jgi:hypothetical protein
MKRRSSFTFGLLLILLGAWFLAVRFVPELGDWMQRIADWPIWVIAPGLIFILAGLISGTFDLMVPGSIISGIGLILYYQNETGDWQSWAYAWALIICFVGIGVFLSNLFKGRFRDAFEEGGAPFMTGLIMFLIFGSIFRAMFGQSPLLGDYWPVLLIVVGLWSLIRPFFRRKRKAEVVVNVSASTDTVDATAEDVTDWEAELESALEDPEDDDSAAAA